jgi:hypothetical protein
LRHAVETSCISCHLVHAHADDVMFALPAISTLQELQVHRTWDPAQHPQWLVFEVEGRLQVRPAQHAIARHLLGHPGAIAQLNMGEGKTRVILPLLALTWADGSRVVGATAAR